MGCLFGYYGLPAKGLVRRMADILSHRRSEDWEYARVETPNGLTAEIGHAIPPWSGGAHVVSIPEHGLAFGYSGVVFNARSSAAVSSQPSLQSLPGERYAVREADSRHVSPSSDVWGPGTRTLVSTRTTVHRLLDTAVAGSDTALESLEGCFTAALVTPEGLRLVRDHSGVKVLYWAATPERLLFAGEIKALFADPTLDRRMRIGALPEYLTFSFIPGEGTMFERVRELQPGCILTHTSTDTSIRRHFVFENLEWNGSDTASEKDFADRVRADLEESVRECCSVVNHPPAVFLSGGIDSSAVLAVAARQFPDRAIKTFSVHFGKKYANENEFVSLMVERYGTDHTWLEIRPSSFIKRMRRIVWYLDDPIGDPITVPNFLMSETAARSGSLVLNGEGGDPCYGGPKNIPMLMAKLYGPVSDKESESWMERNYLLSFRKCFSDLSMLLEPWVLEQSGGEEALIEIVRPFLQAPKPVSFLNKLMAVNMRLKGANLILVKVDKMSSANGLLALPPLFSRRTVETSMACPPELKLIGSTEKGILKKAVEDIVPGPIIQRPKSGMMVPVRFWFRGEMRRYAKRMLSKKNLHNLGFFNTEYARRILAYDKEDIEGSRHGLKLWMLLTFMLWHEQMIEPQRLH